MYELDLADAELDMILKLVGNDVCNDCEKKGPRWCSINNAVLLCASCARKHQKFNDNISRVKSLEGDLWSKKEIKLLFIGGNERFNKLISSYNIALSQGNTEYKYHTKIAQFYRGILIEEVNDQKLSNLIKPSLKEGIELTNKEEFNKLFEYNPSEENIIKNNNNSDLFNNNFENNSSGELLNTPLGYSNNNSREHNKSSEAESFRGQNNQDDSLEKQWNNFTSSMGNMFDALSNKAKKIDYNEKIRNAGAYIQQKKEKIENSDTFKGFLSAMSSGFDSFVKGTEKLIDKGYKEANEYWKNNISNEQYQSNNNSNINPSFNQRNYFDLNNPESNQNERSENSNRNNHLNNSNIPNPINFSSSQESSHLFDNINKNAETNKNEKEKKEGFGFSNPFED